MLREDKHGFGMVVVGYNTKKTIRATAFRATCLNVGAGLHQDIDSLYLV